MARTDLFKVKQNMKDAFLKSEYLKSNELSGIKATVLVEAPLMPTPDDVPWIGIYFTDHEIEAKFLSGNNLVTGKPYDKKFNGVIWCFEYDTDIVEMVRKRDLLFTNTLEALKQDLKLDDSVKMLKISGGEFVNSIDDPANFMLGASINFTVEVRG